MAKEGACDRALLLKCASTSLCSKLVSDQRELFANMVVDAVGMLDHLLPLSMIGIKKVGLILVAAMVAIFGQ